MSQSLLLSTPIIDRSRDFDVEGIEACPDNIDDEDDGPGTLYNPLLLYKAGCRPPVCIAQPPHGIAVDGA